MLAAAAVGTVEYRSILEHIRSANPVIEYTQGTQFFKTWGFRLLLVGQGRSESFLLYILGVQMVTLQVLFYALYLGYVFCLSWPAVMLILLPHICAFWRLMVPETPVFVLACSYLSPSCSAGTCENVDLEKKELLIRPYPPGLEEDFTLPYDVPRQNHWRFESKGCKTNMRQWSMRFLSWRLVFVPALWGYQASAHLTSSTIISSNLGIYSLEIWDSKILMKQIG